MQTYIPNSFTSTACSKVLIFVLVSIHCYDNSSFAYTFLKHLIFTFLQIIRMCLCFQYTNNIDRKRTINKKKGNSFTNVIMHILSMCQNCKLCKNNVVIESEIESKIKRALAYNITKEYKDESKKNKSPTKVTTTIDSL